MIQEEIQRLLHVLLPAEERPTLREMSVADLEAVVSKVLRKMLKETKPEPR